MPSGSWRGMISDRRWLAGRVLGLAKLTELMLDSWLTTSSACIERALKWQRYESVMTGTAENTSLISVGHHLTSLEACSQFSSSRILPRMTTAMANTSILYSNNVKYVG